MHDRDERPLGAIADEAYEVLLEAVDAGDGMERDNAYTRLLEADFADGDAEYALNRLLNRGYLYAVEGRLFITEHHSHDSE